MIDLPSPNTKAQLTEVVDAIARLQRGDYTLDLASAHADGLFQPLAQALQELAFSLELSARERDRIDRITARINGGLLLDDVLENVYDDFRELIPYNRIGLSLLDESGQTVVARWASFSSPACAPTPTATPTSRPSSASRGSSRSGSRRGGWCRSWRSGAAPVIARTRN